MYRIIFVLLLFLISTLTQAKDLCALSNAPVYSIAPQTQDKLPKKVESIKAGSVYPVVSNERQWSQVRIGTKLYWVERNQLSDSSICPASVKSQKKSTSASQSSAVSKQQDATQSKRTNTASSGCPCSSRQVCIGPRGGRYCITSGGNKRYGV